MVEDEDVFHAYTIKTFKERRWSTVKQPLNHLMSTDCRSIRCVIFMKNEFILSFYLIKYFIFKVTKS